MKQHKIIKLAKRTHAITLPNEFMLLNNLKKGDLANVEIVNNSLVIKNSKNIDTIINLDLTKLDMDLIWRHLITAYRKGSNNIIVKYSSNSDLNIIQNFVKDLIGMAIVKQDKNTVIIKDLFNKNDIDVKDTIIKISKLLIDSSNEILIALKENNKDVLKDINLQDYNINKFTNLCLRILNIGNYEIDKALSYYKIISILEEVGDEYRRIANVNLRVNTIINKDVLKYFNEVNLLLNDYFEIFNKYDKEKIINFYDKAELLLKRLKSNYSKRKGNEIQILSGLDTILHLIKSLIEENFILSL